MPRSPKSHQQSRAEAIRRRFDVERRRSEVEQRLWNTKQRWRRLIAVVATLAAFGAIAAVAQISDAGTRRRPTVQPCVTPSGGAPPSSAPSSAPSAGPTAGPTAAPSAAPAGDPLAPENIAAHNHSDVNTVGDGQIAGPQPLHRKPGGTACPTPTTPTSPGGGIVLGPKDCSDSSLTEHTGFQVAPACVSTAFGAVPSQANSPSLIITRNPFFVRANTPFSWTFITDNLERSEFLPAAQGGYYAQPARLNGQGIVKGHVHSGCYSLTSTRTAADGSQRAVFFIATEDNLGADGGAAPATINVPGLPAGTYRCISWAGTGSHGVPINQFANQAPAVDAFRLIVR